MKRFLISLSLLVFVIALPVFAQGTNVMDVHVDHPVAIPGNVLRPGNYVFRLLDNLKEVEITSKNDNHDYGFLPVFSTYRSSANGSQIKASRPDASGLARIKSWYFPGSRIGYKFIYSKSEIHKSDIIARNMKSTETQSGM